jgi:hypothetical protein
LVNNDTSFDDYYKVIKDNISKLFQEGYEDAVPLDAINFNMRVWIALARIVFTIKKLK